MPAGSAEALADSNRAIGAKPTDAEWAGWDSRTAASGDGG